VDEGFKLIKRSKQKKKKLMLWIDVDIVGVFEEMHPQNITVQEKMRQVLRHFADGGMGDFVKEEPAKVNNQLEDELGDL